MIDQEEFERINHLRLQAFRTNESQDVENYYKAASSWFQDELGREVRRSYESAAEITQLCAENERLRGAFKNPDREVLHTVCYGTVCYADEFAEILESYWEALK